MSAGLYGGGSQGQSSYESMYPDARTLWDQKIFLAATVVIILQ